MPGESGVPQQGQRTPRAKQHKHSRSAAGPVSDSEGALAQAGSQQKKQHGGRRNQQNRNTPQPAPAWQDSAPPQAEGFFDAHGNFVSPYQDQSRQVTGMFYLSDGAHIQGSAHPKKKGNNKQGKNARHLNGSNTPPHAVSDNEPAIAAAMMQHMTPAKAAAYAGPTFHASPAANALPIPKFFSKSVPNDNAKPGLQARLEQEPDKSDSSDKSDSPPAVQAVTAVPVPDRPNESPLDFLFKADKQQKANRQSSGATLTPPATKRESFGAQPALASPWQSIYGTGPRNHQRQPSNGSGRDMFMMELDGREASPRANHFSPPPPLPKIPQRSASDQYSVPQLSPQATFNNNQRPQSSSYHPMPPNGPAQSNMPRQQPSMDHSFSPFNRAGPAPYPTPRSNETTPIQQNGAYPPQNGYHYGNRNLSPLFKAAKQDPMRPPSNLRQEVQQGPTQIYAAELPDSSPSRPIAHRQASTEAEKAALAFLQTQIPQAQAMPPVPLPQLQPRTHELEGTAAPPTRSGVTPPGVNAYNSNTKNIEDDLKRMLKLSSGIK